MKILFVCTGNTCRSPMAEGIFNHLSQGAVSRGLMAEAGSGASQNAIDALADMGIDITGHRAEQLTEADVNEADLVLTMTKNHKRAIISAMPQGKEKIFTLGEYANGEDVSDPYGQDVDVYKRTAAEIYDYIERIVEKLK